MLPGKALPEGTGVGGLCAAIHTPKTETLPVLLNGLAGHGQRLDETKIPPTIRAKAIPW